MKRTINKRIKRELFSNFWKYFAIFMIIFASVGGISSFFIVQKSVKQGYEDSHKIGNVEDGQISVAFPLEKEGLEILEKNVGSYEKQFFKELEYKKDKTIRVFENREHINLPGIFEGKLPDKENEIAIDRCFAEQNKLKTGDEIQWKEKKFVISGLVALPDYSCLQKSRGSLLISNTNFCVALMSKEGFASLEDVVTSYTYAYRLKTMLSEKEQSEKFSTIFEQLSEKNIPVVDGIIKPLNSNISYVKDDMSGDVPMMYTLLCLITLVMAFIFTVIVKSTIEDESPMIGTLLALGYRKGEIIHHYLMIPMIVTITAVILGNFMAYGFMKQFYLRAYYDNFSLFPFELEENAYAGFFTSLIPIVLVLVINYLVLVNKLKFSPLQFLRKDLKKYGKKTASRVYGSFFQRYRMRVALSNKMLYGVMFIGIILANLLLMFGLSFRPIFQTYLDQIGETMPAKYQYIFRGPTTEIDTNKVDQFTYYQVESKDEFFGKNLSISIFGVPQNAKFFKSYELQKNKIEGYASEGVFVKLKAKIGDEIELYDKYKGRNFKVKLVGKNNYTATLAIYMDQTALNTIMGEKEEFYNGYFSDEKLNIDKDMLLSEVNGNDIKKIGEQMLIYFKNLLPIVTSVAGAIYFVVIYVLSNLIIDRSSLSICYLKIFGYTKKEIENIYLDVTTWIIFIFQILAIPVMRILFKYCVLISMSKFDGYIAPNIPWMINFVPFFAGLCIYFAVRWLQMKKIQKKDMSEALKEIAS